MTERQSDHPKKRIKRGREDVSKMDVILLCRPIQVYFDYALLSRKGYFYNR